MSHRLGNDENNDNHKALRFLCQAVARSFLPVPSEQEGSETPSPTSTQVDPDHLVELAKRHRVEALAALGLKGTSWAAHFENAQVRNAMLQMRQAKAAREIFAEFDAQNILCTTVKGPAVATFGYAQPALRTSIDIDLLIHPESLPAVRKSLAELGFVQAYPDFPVAEQNWSGLMKVEKGISYRRPSDHIQLDLHWRAFRNPHLWPEFEEKWPTWVARFEEGLWSGVPHLPPAQTLAYCIIHGAYSGWFRLKWLADVHGLIKQMSVDECDTALKHLRRADLLALTVAARDLSQDWFGTDFPPSWAALETSRASERLRRRQERLLTARYARPETKLKRIYRSWEDLRVHQSLKAGHNYQVRQVLNELLMPNVLRAGSRVILPLFATAAPTRD